MRSALDFVFSKTAFSETAFSETASLASLVGAPFVIAFVETWDASRTSEAELAKVRAELRGIGATLIVVAEDRAWKIGADDPGEVAAQGGAVYLAQRRQLWRSLSDREMSSPAVFVFDATGTLRFSFVDRGRGDPLVGLRHALSAAGKAMLSAPEPQPPKMTRREWTTLSLVAAFTMALAESCSSPHDTPPDASTPPVPGPSDEVDLTLRINGQVLALRVDPRTTLLDALRERLGFTGTKKGCDHGQCGACTVLVGDRRVNACLMLALMAEGSEITTIEGLSHGDELHPVQQAFLEEDALQCGFCTPGQIMSAVGFLGEGGGVDPAEIREGMSGNICRCGAYPNIVSAIVRAKRGA